MNPSQKVEISDTGVSVTQLGYGGVPLGDATEIISDEQAQATLAAAYDGGLRYFDTAPWYGNTKSEHRLGQFLRNKPRESFVLSSKIGRVYTRPDDVADFMANSPWAKRWRGGLPFDLRFDYTYDGVMRSYEDSLTRMGLPKIDFLAIHDLDPRHQKSEDGVIAALNQLEGGRGFAALQALKDQGEIAAIGAGVNETGMIPRFVERFEMDYFLIASPYNLLDQPALDGDLPLCVEHNISVVLGAAFASGILATGAHEGAQYRYKNADGVILDKVRAMEDICARHGVELAAAALQFPLHHPAVATVIAGANHPDQIAANLAQFAAVIPSDLWSELKQQGFLRQDAPAPVPTSN